MKICRTFLTLGLLCLLAPVCSGAELNYVEYFIDTDPGEGNGVPLLILSDSLGSYAYFTNLLLLDLPYGEHVFYTRFRDTQGRYSLPRGKKFNVAAKPNLVTSEEFIDNDPGEGSGQPKDVTDGMEATSFQAHNHSLPQGAKHVFYTRYQTEDGTWSDARGKRFNLAPSQTLTNAEYFLEPDPGRGNGTSMDIADAVGEAFDFRNAVTPSGLGLKTLGARYQTANGGWSFANHTKINVLPVSSSGLIHIGGAEVFIGSDPGEGNGIAMAAEDGAFDELEERAFVAIQLDSNAFGLRRVCMRVRDASGTWTNAMCDTVLLPVRLVIKAQVTANPPTYRDIKLWWTEQEDAVEYRVHSDSVVTGPFTSYTAVFAPDTSYTTPLDTTKTRLFYFVVPYTAAALAGELGKDEGGRMKDE